MNAHKHAYGWRLMSIERDISSLVTYDMYVMTMMKLLLMSCVVKGASTTSVRRQVYDSWSESRDGNQRAVFPSATTNTQTPVWICYYRSHGTTAPFISPFYCHISVLLFTGV